MTFSCSRRQFAGLSAAFGVTLLGLPARAQTPLPEPKGKVILTIDGLIRNKDREGQANFDMDMLEGLGMEGFETSTPWHQGKVRFDGVRMDKVMQTVGATGTKLKVRALNNYVVDMDIEDFAKFGVLLATRRDGQPMPVRDKGPLFVIYPFDSNPMLHQARYYTRSAWQTRTMTVE